MKKTLLILSFAATAGYAQVSEDFSDGNYTADPSWTGETANFEILNEELHLLAPAVSDESYLVTTTESINNAVWEFSIRLEFNPSSTNYTKVYLVSDSDNLKGNLQGYFVKVGSTADDISLFKQNGSTETIIIDGGDGKLNSSIVSARVRVTRDDVGNWEIFTDVGETGIFTSEGTAFDDTFIKSSYFGLLCHYTSTRSDKFFLDDVNVSGDPWVDLQAPQMTGYEILSENSISISFDEPLLATSVIPENFSLNSFQPVQLELQEDELTIILVFDFNFTNGFTQNVTFQNISDAFNNIGEIVQFNFLYFVEISAEQNDVILNEFFPDPSPVIQLPESEFLELLNRSSKPFQLSGWTISDGNSTGTLDSYLLLPDSLLILCPNSYISQYSTYGNVLGVSPWPTQNNTGDALILRDASGQLIDSILYNDSWYGDPDKESGGFSLEKINPDLNCNMITNWRGSNDERGGTPGSINSIHSLLPDQTAPKVIEASFSSPNMIGIKLDEPPYGAWQEVLVFYIEPEIDVDSIRYVDEELRFNIFLSDSIQNEIAYSIHISGPADCSGNVLSSEFQLSLDFNAPSITGLEIIHPNELVLEFDESPNSTSLVKSNFVINAVNPVKVVILDSNLVSLEFGFEMQDGLEYSLETKSLKDFKGNTGGEIFKFVYTTPPEPGFLDIIITEIMVDPEPGVGTLPISAYVEILNRTQNDFSLKGLLFQDGNSSTSSKEGLLKSGEYALLVPSTQKANFNIDTPVIGLTSWPTLNQTEDELSILNRKGELLHRVNYNKEWYNDFYKSEGGWSLEMVDVANPCGAANNWTASESLEGGTPGKENSVQNENPDNFGPSLKFVIAIDSVTVVLSLNEDLHPLKTPEVSLVPELMISAVEFLEGTFNTVRIVLQNPMIHRVPYKVSFEAADCPGNSTTALSDEFYLPEPGAFNDIVINEILFNPITGGVDFVELFNRSEKHILLSGWNFLSYDEDGPNDAASVTEDFVIISPGEYLVLTSEKLIFLNQFPFVDVNQILEVSLPSLPDESGSFLVFDAKNLLIDSMYYHEDWHHPLLETNEGVTLERRSSEISSIEKDNWKSAASTAGFATPGKLNSQHYTSRDSPSNVLVEPDLIFPGTGGGDSFTTISYDFEKTDIVASVNIFATNGLLVRRLVSNQLLATTGIFTWDGTDDKGSKVALGHYFVVMDVFAPDGYKERFRKKVAVGVR